MSVKASGTSGSFSMGKEYWKQQAQKKEAEGPAPWKSPTGTDYVPIVSEDTAKTEQPKASKSTKTEKRVFKTDDIKVKVDKKDLLHYHSYNISSAEDSSAAQQAFDKANELLVYMANNPQKVTVWNVNETGSVVCAQLENGQRIFVTLNKSGEIEELDISYDTSEEKNKFGMMADKCEVAYDKNIAKANPVDSTNHYAHGITSGYDFEKFKEVAKSIIEHRVYHQNVVHGEQMYNPKQATNERIAAMLPPQEREAFLQNSAKYIAEHPQAFGIESKN